MNIIIDPALEQYREHVEHLADVFGHIQFRVELSEFGSYASYHSPTTIWIDLDECKTHGWNVILVIAHEMRHTFQYKQGWLGPCSRKFLVGMPIYTSEWHGEIVSQMCSSLGDYEQLPWEKDANDFANEYVASLQKSAIAA